MSALRPVPPCCAAILIIAITCLATSLETTRRTICGSCWRMMLPSESTTLSTR